MTSIDMRLFLLLNGLVGRQSFIDRLVSLVINDYFVPVSLSLALFGLWFAGRSNLQRERNQRAVICAITALGPTNLVIWVLNQFYFRPRPFADQAVNLLMYRPPDSSFPSNSVAVAFTIATAIWLGNRAAGGSLYTLACLLAFARVYGGIHYPLDIVGGATIGIMSSIGIHWVLRAIEPVPTLALKLARRLYLA